MKGWQDTSSSRIRHLWRAFWMVVLLVHFIALGPLFESPTGGRAESFGTDLIRGGGLLLGVLFCALKLLDVSFLRLKPGWRSFVCASVAMALLHVGLLERAHGGRDAAVPVGVVLFIGTFADVRALNAFVRKCVSAGAPPSSRDDAHVHLNPYLHTVEAAFEPVHLLFAPRTDVPRAPPGLSPTI